VQRDWKGSCALIVQAVCHLWSANLWHNFLHNGSSQTSQLVVRISRHGSEWRCNSEHWLICFICKGWASKFVPSSDMKHLWGLWITLFIWVGYKAVAKPSILEDHGFLFRVFFSQTNFLWWLTSSVCPPHNPQKGPLPGASHLAHGTWSSHKVGSSLPVIGVSLVRVPTCYPSNLSSQNIS
jgi:hypothetical protein